MIVVKIIAIGYLLPAFVIYMIGVLFPKFIAELDVDLDKKSNNPLNAGWIVNTGYTIPLVNLFIFVMTIVALIVIIPKLIIGFFIGRWMDCQILYWELKLVHAKWRNNRVWKLHRKRLVGLGFSESRASQIVEEIRSRRSSESTVMESQ